MFLESILFSEQISKNRLQLKYVFRNISFSKQFLKESVAIKRLLKVFSSLENSFQTGLGLIEMISPV